MRGRELQLVPAAVALAMLVVGPPGARAQVEDEGETYVTPRRPPTGTGRTGATGDGEAEPPAPPAADEGEAARGDSDDGDEPAPTSVLPTSQSAIGRAGDPGGFFFGSYGRVVAASDLDGGLGRDADIVSHGPRIDEGVYVELELRREDPLPDGMRSVIVSQLAVAGPLFHLDAEFDEAVAIRNLFAEVQNALVPGLDVWAGSRMVRGDDIYLLDFWPMDNLNVLGGGLRLRVGDELADLGLTVGLSRPNDPFHRQTIEDVAPIGFGTREVVFLDRPRFVLASKATFYPVGYSGPQAFKVAVYGEGHYLPSGTRQVEAEGGVEPGGVLELPAESGYVLGAQLGGWIVESRSFANLFFRYARGLGAINPLGVPFREGGVMDLDRAREIQLGLSANFEHGMLGVQVGAYYRNFRDASPTPFEGSQVAEGAVIARPHIWFGERAGLALEASYQAMETSQLDDRTGQVVRGGVTKLGIIPFLSPMGRGTYTRPHLRLIYSLTLRDADARRLYPALDPRSQKSAEHFLGIGAEWWFASTSYGR